MSECPACGEPYSATVTVVSADRLMDTFPAPPYTTFKKYARVCSHSQAAGEKISARNNGIELYFHTHHDTHSQLHPANRP